MIGIFDSGIGGLSVFREILKVLPLEKYGYYADNANCPYGEKSKGFIINRARSISDHLIKSGADIIVVACNTATAAAIATLRAEYPIKFIGMEPAIKPAALSTKTGVIGVLATAGTLKADKYLDIKGKYAEGIKISEHIGQGFVELVEKGVTSGKEAESIIRASLKPLLDEGADRIVLGCTHYPFLKDTIIKVAEDLYPGRDIEIIDPAPAVAKHTFEVMQAERLIRNDGYSMNLRSSGSSEILKKAYDSIKKEVGEIPF